MVHIFGQIIVIVGFFRFGIEWQEKYLSTKYWEKSGKILFTFMGFYDGTIGAWQP